MTHPGSRAYAEGFAAEPGARNPYPPEQVVAGRMWRRGYQAMLKDRIDNSSAMQRYRAAQDG